MVVPGNLLLPPVNTRRMELLKPILLSGGGRTGSTQIMSLLGSDPRVTFDRAFPYENRYLTYFAKFALLLQHPDLLQYCQPQQLFELNYLGFGGYTPGPDYVPEYSPYVYLPRSDAGAWFLEMWRKFSEDVLRVRSDAAFYAEKVPLWLAPMLRQYMEVITIYNLRDPRDIFLSSNAFMNKRNGLGFARTAEQSDYDHARRITQAFLNNFENYYHDHKRQDTLLVRYEDYVSQKPVVLESIKKLTGTDLKPDSDYFNSAHATVRDVRESVERWKREAIAPGIVLLMERILHEELKALGYSLSVLDGNRPAQTISFADERTNVAKLAHSSHGALQPDGDCALVQVRGPDFHMYLPVEPFEAAEVSEVWVSLSGGVGNIASLYWRRRDTRFGESSAIHLSYSPAPHWGMLTFPVHTHPEWQGRITELRLDVFNSHLRPNAGIGRIRSLRLVP